MAEQQQREKLTFEAFYPRISAIPDSWVSGACVWRAALLTSSMWLPCVFQLVQVMCFLVCQLKSVLNLCCMGWLHCRPIEPPELPDDAAEDSIPRIPLHPVEDEQLEASEADLLASSPVAMDQAVGPRVSGVVLWSSDGGPAGLTIVLCLQSWAGVRVVGLCRTRLMSSSTVCPSRRLGHIYSHSPRRSRSRSRSRIHRGYEFHVPLISPAWMPTILELAVCATWYRVSC